MRLQLAQEYQIYVEYFLTDKVANVKPVSSVGSAMPSTTTLLSPNTALMVGMCNLPFTSPVDRSASPGVSFTAGPAVLLQ